MIDIYSRYIVGAHVHNTESGPLAVDMMAEVFNMHGVPQVVHADRGTSMTSKTVAALLADLEVAFMSDFVDFYNHHHRHLGVGLHTPADVHYGHARDVQQRRLQTLAAARQQHPTRFTTATTPKILNLPEAAWINQPAAQATAA